MNRTKNKYRHRWVDQGAEDGVELYVYDCLKCGLLRIRGSLYSYSYWRGEVGYGRAPECVPSRPPRQKVVSGGEAAPNV